MECYLNALVASDYLHQRLGEYGVGALSYRGGFTLPSAPATGGVALETRVGHSHIKAGLREQNQ